MAKKESKFGNMVITLVLITAIAGLALSFVHKLTEAPIREAQAAKLKKALTKVLPEFDDVTSKMVMPVSGPDSIEFYTATKDGETVGIAVKTYTNNGFSGHFDILVGFYPSGVIINTAVLGHKETPGLGDKMDEAKSDFPIQFKEKDPASFNLKVTKDGGDVDAITASTISSRGFCDAVDRAYQTLMKEGGNHE
ncbi:MAG: RnfABCDGE type electron transport complex subunit G [Bacteroidales bacterium]|nr:RnfABCDGE type electron transport complex subunit G [Bacteroidales bacterium]